MPAPEVTPAEAQVVLAHRQLAQARFGPWCQLAMQDDGFKPASHHWLLIRKLEAVERGEISRLMVIMPPGSAKTTYGSILFPLWFVSRRRSRKVILASYGAARAEAVNGKAHDVLAEYGHWLGIKPETHAVSLWHTDNDGEFLAAGVGGPITGFRADCVIIDDAVKSEEDVDSEVKRDTTWKWFWSAVNTRVRAGKKATADRAAIPGGAIIIIMTRWHQDDLAGRLLERDPEGWDVLHLCAEAEEKFPDPLHRPDGAMLWDDDPEYDFGTLLRLEKAKYEKQGMLRTWRALYQGDPMPGDGSLFDANKITTVAAAPAGGQMVRSWDLAGSVKTSARNPDWTVGVLMQLFEDRIYIRDIVRFRGRWDEVKRRMKETAIADGKHVAVTVPQDNGQAGLAQVQDLVAMLAGFVVKAIRPDTKKEARAAPFSAQVNVGNVYMVSDLGKLFEKRWNAAFIEELSAFPAGTFDDQVDACSDAYSVVSVPRVKPARMVKFNLLER